MKIGLLFGSFNPIHIGHLLIATLMRENSGLDEVWLVVSPLNPFKINSDLADENHRLEMVKIAVKDSDHLKLTAIEYNLSRPSYTHQTLKELKSGFPNHIFSVIIGEDNVSKFSEWKESGWILDNFEILVYNRSTPNKKEAINDTIKHPGLKTFTLPVFDISSTEIRDRIKNNKAIRYFVPETVEQYIRFHKLYS